MGDVEVYLSTVDGADRAALERVYAAAREIVPEAEEGTSYAMAALVYRGEGLIATVRRRNFLSLYPYSGKVIAGVSDALSDFDITSGSVHYSADHELPTAIVYRIVEARRSEIDSKVG